MRGESFEFRFEHAQCTIDVCAGRGTVRSIFYCSLVLGLVFCGVKVLGFGF